MGTPEEGPSLELRRERGPAHTGVSPLASEQGGDTPCGLSHQVGGTGSSSPGTPVRTREKRPGRQHHGSAGRCGLAPPGGRWTERGRRGQGPLISLCPQGRSGQGPGHLVFAGDTLRGCPGSSLSGPKPLLPPPRWQEPRTPDRGPAGPSAGPSGRRGSHPSSGASPRQERARTHLPHRGPERGLVPPQLQGLTL